MNNLDPDVVSVGDQLPSMEVALTRTSIVASAMATRDWQDVHHDHLKAQASGLSDIIVSIPTTTAYVGRFITGWAGPNSVLKSSKVRLGAPAYPNDVLTFSGHVAEKSGDVLRVDFEAVTPTGTHASGQVVVALRRAGEHV